MVLAGHEEAGPPADPLEAGQELAPCLEHRLLREREVEEHAQRERDREEQARGMAERDERDDLSHASSFAPGAAQNPCAGTPSAALNLLDMFWNATSAVSSTSSSSSNSRRRRADSAPPAPPWGWGVDPPVARAAR